MENVMKFEFEPYFEDDLKANDWINQMLPLVRSQLFHNQTDWLYLANELGKRRNPMTRSNATSYILDLVMQTITDDLAVHITSELLREFAEDDVDFDTVTASWYNGYNNYDMTDNKYVKPMEDDPGHL